MPRDRIYEQSICLKINFENKGKDNSKRQIWPAHRALCVLRVWMGAGFRLMMDSPLGFTSGASVIRRKVAPGGNMDPGRDVRASNLPSSWKPWMDGWRGEDGPQPRRIPPDSRVFSHCPHLERGKTNIGLSGCVQRDMCAHAFTGSQWGVCREDSLTRLCVPDTQRLPYSHLSVCT